MITNSWQTWLLFHRQGGTKQQGCLEICRSGTGTIFGKWPDLHLCLLFGTNCPSQDGSTLCHPHCRTKSLCYLRTGFCLDALCFCRRTPWRRSPRFCWLLPLLPLYFLIIITPNKLDLIHSKSTPLLTPNYPQTYFRLTRKLIVFNQTLGNSSIGFLASIITNVKPVLLALIA